MKNIVRSFKFLGVLLVIFSSFVLFQNCSKSNSANPDLAPPVGSVNQLDEVSSRIQNVTALLPVAFKNGGYLTDISKDGKKILLVSKALEMSASNAAIGTEVILEVLVEDLTIVKKIPFPRSLRGSTVRYNFDSSMIIIVGAIAGDYAIETIKIKDGRKTIGASPRCRELIFGNASNLIACFTIDRKIRIFDFGQDAISELSMPTELDSYLIGLGYTDIVASGFSFLQNDRTFAFLGWHEGPSGCTVFSLDLVTSQISSFPIPTFRPDPDLGSTFCKLSFSMNGRYLARVSGSSAWTKGYYSPNTTNIILFDLSTDSAARLVTKTGKYDAGNGNSSDPKFANERIFFLTEAVNLGAVGLTLVFADIVADKPIVPTISNVIGGYLVSKNGLTAAANTNSGWIVWTGQP